MRISDGVVGDVRRAAAGVRSRLGSGSHSAPAAVLTLTVIGATGLVDWPVLLGVGGAALVVQRLGQRSGRLPAPAVDDQQGHAEPLPEDDRVVREGDEGAAPTPKEAAWRGARRASDSFQRGPGSAGTGCLGGYITPALLIRRSIVAKADFSWSAAARTDAGEVGSSCWTVVSAPETAPAIRSAACLPLSTSRTASTIDAPHAASARAVSNPSPLLAWVRSHRR